MQKLSLAALFLLAACSREVTTTTTTTETATVSSPSTTTDTPPPPPAQAPEAPTVDAVKGPKLQPVDEATSDPTLVAFRDSLLASVRRQDEAALLDALDPKVRTSFGNGGGKAGFQKQWLTGKPKQNVWEVLDFVLSHGGSWQKGGDTKRFWAPYVYSAWPESADSFESFAVIAPDVPLHKTADPASPSIATLQWDIVTRADTRQVPQKSSLLEVRTADGRKGWVETKYLRSPIDYRAGLVKTPGGWKIEALVAGD